ncbi:hypothetical protein VIGAN_UM004500, partial [Vigna angularis var. angularis]
LFFCLSFLITIFSGSRVLAFQRFCNFHRTILLTQLSTRSLPSTIRPARSSPFSVRLASPCLLLFGSSSLPPSTVQLDLSMPSTVRLPFSYRSATVRPLRSIPIDFTSLLPSFSFSYTFQTLLLPPTLYRNTATQVF